jgi:hypothetical protein
MNLYYFSSGTLSDIYRIVIEMVFSIYLNNEPFLNYYVFKF